MVTDASLIKQLGTDAEVAAMLKAYLPKPLTDESVRKMRELGIPWKHRAAMARLFKARRIKLPSDFIEVRRK